MRDLAVSNSNVNSTHCLLKEIESNLKMTPKEGVETCSLEQ